MSSQLPSAERIYAELPEILNGYLTDPTAKDGRPSTTTAYLYKRAFATVLEKLAAGGVAYPPTAIDVTTAAAASMTQSRLTHFKTAWRWVRKAAQAYVAKHTDEPVAQAALLFPEPPDTAVRDTKSKHPAGLAICMWIEALGAGDLAATATRTYHDANVALHNMSPKSRHDAALGSLKAIRKVGYGDFNLGTYAEPNLDPIFRDPITKQPMTEVDLKNIIKTEGLTAAQLKKGYFLNNVVWNQTDGETYVGCTFQYEVQASRGLTVPMPPYQVGTIKVTPAGTSRVIIEDPYYTLNDPRNPATVGGPETHRETYGRQGEQITEAVNEWWKTYYEFHCICHGPPVKPKTKIQQAIDSLLYDDLKALQYANFLGMGAQQMFDPDWKGPKELDTPVAPVPIPEPLPPPKPKSIPATPGQPEVLPGAMPAGKCSDCALHDDPACADKVAANVGCEFFATAADLEDPQ